MSDTSRPLDERVEELYQKLRADAEAGGYHLNPDEAFTRELIAGILANIDRYGYGACPCRLASGDRAEDLDLICPCDYRDPDLDDFGACYCALYVSREIAEGAASAPNIPDRRPVGGAGESAPAKNIAQTALKYPVYRCKVCGYLCAREKPPAVCPVCKAGKDRFELFM